MNPSPAASKMLDGPEGNFLLSGSRGSGMTTTLLTFALARAQHRRVWFVCSSQEAVNNAYRKAAVELAEGDYTIKNERWLTLRFPGGSLKLTTLRGLGRELPSTNDTVVIDFDEVPSEVAVLSVTSTVWNARELVIGIPDPFAVPGMLTRRLLRRTIENGSPRLTAGVGITYTYPGRDQ